MDYIHIYKGNVEEIGRIVPSDPNQAVSSHIIIIDEDSKTTEILEKAPSITKGEFVERFGELLLDGILTGARREELSKKGENNGQSK